MAKLLCEDCHQNAGSIMCCGLVFCLKHYHCTFHSEHPKNAKIIDREAYNAHIDSFKELRKKAFSEVYLLLQDVDEEYHQALKKEDPLAFFAEKRKSKTPTRKRQQKRPSKSLPSESEPQVQEDPNPYKRRKSRPKQMWKTGDASNAPELKKSSLNHSDYKCPVCQSEETFYTAHSKRTDISKSETWGRKEEVAVRIQVTCKACGHVWHEED
mmetsp:Transcript_25835/g.33884  ORF Transcript_25835/g.33884 Transcript_25835/m.33884 type:complete len:212 (+) Transcript_25835:201-836(+)